MSQVTVETVESSSESRSRIWARMGGEGGRRERGGARGSHSILLEKCVETKMFGTVLQKLHTKNLESEYFKIFCTLRVSSPP